MKSILESPQSSEPDQHLPEDGKDDRWAILQELDSILASRFFKSAGRCRQFLRYVVLSKLDGQIERLKERTIGIEVFKRPAGYSTGEDPVVRVQAGEVRRRLEQYYQESPQPSPLRIELPLGSYSPVFHRGTEAEIRVTPTRPAPAAAPPVSRWNRRLKVVSLLLIGMLAAIAGRALIDSWHRVASPKTALEKFWGPAIASHQPVLICLANTPDNSSGEGDIYQRFSKTHSSASQAEIGSITTSLPLDPDEKAADGEPVSSESVPAADASVAVALSRLFGKLDRPTQLRVGAAATYEDLRNFPATVIGGFDSRWTMQLVSNLQYAFIWDHGQYMIRERAPGGRVWTTRLGPHGETIGDFAIVGRLIDSKTGQFTVTVAGIGPRGTQAAGEFVSSSRYLEEGLAHAPADWQNRNLEVLLQATVTDSVAGPPHVIAAYTW